MRGTFLLQYDALINPRYQSLLKEEMKRGTEVGGWWEITQPHVEAVGLKWRGRYPWDWHADVGFAVGYTPEEREKLVDVYMEKFKEIFGKYPASVGSWFIDAHTLRYMYENMALCHHVHVGISMEQMAIHCGAAIGIRPTIPVASTDICLHRRKKDKFPFRYSAC